MNKTQDNMEVTNPSLSFVQHLTQKLQDAPPPKKGARTREGIIIATAQMLEEHGYHEMRVIDITECAGISEGTFYVYFTDKKGDGPNEYIHRSGEDSGKRPWLTIDESGRFWVAGGNYSVPDGGITD